MKLQFGNIKLWLLLFFLVRLIGITNPPLESHNWRQTTVNMVARNFLEIDANILYPRLDNNGEKEGVTGMEFPLLNYAIYATSKIFGYSHWYGRLLNLIVSTFGVLYFFKILNARFPKLALNASLILLCSIWFAYSRKIMPDTFATSLIIIGVYWGLRFLESKKANHAIWYVLFIGLGALSKIPAAFLLSIFVLLLPYQKRKTSILFTLYSVIALTPSLLWYFYWVPHLNETYQFPHFYMGTSLSSGLSELWANLSDTLKRFYEDPLKFTGFALFIVGLASAFIKKNKKLIGVFLATFIIFFLFMAKSGYNFAHHSYYIIPFTPIMALIASYGLSKIPVKWVVSLLLIAICLEGILNQIHDFRSKESNDYLLTFEQELDAISDREDLILINSANIPTSLYFAHRKGWVTDTEKLNSSAYIQDKTNRGLEYILIIHGYGIPDALEKYEKVVVKEDYTIYKLDE